MITLFVGILLLMNMQIVVTNFTKTVRAKQQSEKHTDYKRFSSP